MEGRVFKQDLLNAADEAELCGLDDLAKLTHETDVLHQLVILASFQVVEQLVHDDKVAFIAVLTGEGSHHCHERIFIICDISDVGELICNAATRQILLDVACDNRAERCFSAANFDTEHLKLTGDRLCGFAEFFILCKVKI